MKKLTYIFASAFLGLTIMSFVPENTEPSKSDNIQTSNMEVVPNAKEIIDNKCYGCHNSESKNKKGKKKLSFDTFDKLSIYKQIGKYEGIHETITEGEMPPEKFLAKYPNKALTNQEKEILINWATTKGKELAE